MTQQDVRMNKNKLESDLKLTAKWSLRVRLTVSQKYVSNVAVLYIMTGDFGLKCYDSVDVKRFVLGNKNP